MSTVAIKEKPILFSAPMVRAILAGRKTQTRRVVNPQYNGDKLIGPEYYPPVVVDRHGEECEGPEIFGAYDEWGEYGVKCPYEVGMRLWVRETWRWFGRYRNNEPEGGFEYRADLKQRRFEEFAEPDEAWKQFDIAMILGTANKWRPSIHMPRWASRLALEIHDVQVERLQQISEEDAQYEGAKRPILSEQSINGMRVHPLTGYYRDGFRELWDSINGKKHPWASNPWVWAISFKRALAEPSGATKQEQA